MFWRTMWLPPCPPLYPRQSGFREHRGVFLAILAEILDYAVDDLLDLFIGIFFPFPFNPPWSDGLQAGAVDASDSQNKQTTTERTFMKNKVIAGLIVAGLIMSGAAFSAFAQNGPSNGGKGKGYGAPPQSQEERAVRQAACLEKNAGVCPNGGPRVNCQGKKMGKGQFKGQCKGQCKGKGGRQAQGNGLRDGTGPRSADGTCPNTNAPAKK